MASVLASSTMMSSKPPGSVASAATISSARGTMFSSSLKAGTITERHGGSSAAGAPAVCRVMIKA
jgi:hypothetical protein